MQDYNVRGIMVFQLNNKKFSRISRILKPARKAFLTGDTKQAFQLVDNLRRKKAKLLKKSEDVALLRDIHISVGRTHTAQAIIRYACRCFPGDIFVQSSGLILKSQRHNSMSLLEQAKALEILCRSSEDFALWNAVNARLSAGLGMMETSAEWLKKAESLLKISYFEAWHHYCLTHLIRRDWVNAVKHAQSLINVDSCLDNRIMLVRALLSKGDLTQAKLHIKSIDAAKGQSYMADSLAIQFYYFIGNFDAAISRLESLRSHWPEIPTSSIDSTMVQLYWLQGDVESAKILAKSTNDTFLDTLNTANSNAKRKLIALPVMMQEPMMCLPTTVAMVASAYETELVARDLFHDMRGNDGTEIWRMQQHMESIGFEVFYIYPNYKLVKACLDRGHPLIGSKVSLFSAHVEVIAGYDEGLDGLFIRDPESLTPYFVDKEYLSTAYKAAGNYLMALAPRRALNWLPNSAINQDATNIIQLKRAIALGALDKAQQCFDAITDNSESSYYRDLYAFGVFLSPLQYIESMKLHASRDELDDILRLNAVLSTQDVALIQDWVTDYQEKHKTLSKDFNQYLKMLIVRTQRNYAEVLKIIDYLIARSPSTDALWSYKAEAELELGEMEAAKKSIQIALDLSPTSYGVKRKIREISPYQESYNDKLSQMKTQLDEYPGIYELEEELADLLIEGSDGLEYEQSIKACIIKRPLFPWNYNKLANWYLQQDREDLARNILDQGRLLLTEEELPRRYFEVDQSPSREIQQESCSIEGLLRSIEAKSSSKEALKCLRNMINGWFSGHLPSESEQHLLHQLDFRIPKWLMELPLSWWEQAYLIGITYAIKDRKTDRDQKHNTLTKFLPARLPHNTALMLLAINKAVKIYPLSPVACSCLYEWETKQFDGKSEWRHDVAFDLAYLRELSGYFNEAQARYADIIKRIPGYYPAYYRVACVYDRKGMKNEAIQQYLSCISIAPNHAGALSSLIDVLTNLNEIPQARDWCEYKVKVNPYSFSCIEQWINYIEHVDGIEQAWKSLADCQANLTGSGEKALRARLLERKGHFKAARMLLRQIKDKEQYERHIHVTRTRCAIGQDDWSLVSRLADEALKKDPYDIWFVETKVSALENLEAKDIQDFVIEQFGKQIFSENLASAWLRAVLGSRNEPRYVRECANDILQRALDPATKFSLFRYLCGYFASYSMGHDYLSWLNMCNEEFPNNLFFIERIVDYYRFIGNIDKAIAVAKTLYDSNPEDADYILIYGRILEDKNPELALKHLKDAYAKTGSIECLSRIGRAYHNLGNHNAAKQAYWHVLAKNPLDDLSINNLLVLGEDPKTIYPYITDAINNGIGHNTEYFLVSAVKTAIQLKTTVPPLWLNLAENRFKQLQSDAGYHDEKPRMAKALYEWYMYRGDKEKAENVLHRADIKKPIFGSFKWPGRKWIPGDPA